MIIVDWDELEDDEIDDKITPLIIEDIADEEDRTRISKHNQRLDSLSPRQKVVRNQIKGQRTDEISCFQEEGNNLTKNNSYL